MKRDSGTGENRIRLLAAGEPAPAFSDIFKDYYAALCYYAERIYNAGEEAEDLVSGVFMKLYDRSEPFSDLHHLQSYLYRATRNACLDHLRKSEREKERQLFFLQESEHFGKSETQELIRVEVLRSIYLEIQRLPEQCGKIISMSFVEGRKNEEIAEELGLSLQTVKNQKSRGLALLRLRVSAEMFAALLFFMGTHY